MHSLRFALDNFVQFSRRGSNFALISVSMITSYRTSAMLDIFLNSERLACLGHLGMVSVEESTNTLIIEQEDGATRIVEMPSQSAHVTMWREIAENTTKGVAVSYTSEDALQELMTVIHIDTSVKVGQPAVLRLPNQ